MSDKVLFFRVTRDYYGVPARQVGFYTPDSPLKAVEFPRMGDASYFVSLKTIECDKDGIFERVHENEDEVKSHPDVM